MKAQRVWIRVTLDQFNLKFLFLATKLTTAIQWLWEKKFTSETFLFVFVLLCFMIQNIFSRKMIRVNTGKKARFLTWDDTCVEFNNLHFYET